MRRILLTISLLILGWLSVPQAFEPDEIAHAVGILYSQNSQGGMTMHCTATAFERIDTDVKGVKTPKAYRFLTAAHCVGSDDTSKERSANPSTTPFFITFDEGGKEPKRFYPATPVLVGYQTRGEDVAEFEVATTDVWPVVPLGDEKKAKDGDSFVNVSAPLGLGKQTFRGQISSVYIDRPVISGDINWRGSIALQIVGINGGSSGSAIVHDKQHAIVGVLVGSIGGSTIIAVPISKFTAVRMAVIAGKYRWYVPETSINPDGSPAAE